MKTQLQRLYKSNKQAEKYQPTVVRPMQDIPGIATLGPISQLVDGLDTVVLNSPPVDVPRWLQ